jgi:DNA-directed RNA polymerase specialized sigma24 family protein
VASAYPTYSEVVTAAVNDFALHGYDTPERLTYWQQQIAAAAERSMASTPQLEQMLREAYVAIYSRIIGPTGEIKTLTGPTRFTSAQLKDRLRGELNRRILASSDLIRLNKEQAKAKTLQRFSGWASSVPPGGSKSAEKAEAKESVKKALRQLPFEERRVIVDQGHKLAASLNEVIARDGQAIAVTWKSNWRQSGYNYRKDHKERDGKIYLLKESWAKLDGLVKKGDAGFYEDVTAFSEEPFCRCRGIYLYHLRDLPPEMLTKKGEATLEAARAKLKTMGF